MREKLTQSTFTRLIYIINLSHACILLFSIITIVTRSFKTACLSKTHQDHPFTAEEYSVKEISLYIVWGRDTSCSFAAFERQACQALTGEWIEPVMLNMHPIVLDCVGQIHCQHIFCFSLCLPPPPSFVAVVGNLHSSYWIEEEYTTKHAASAGVTL